MPVIKSAKKKLRQDKKRQEQNKMVKDTLKEALKKAKKESSQETIRLATKAADKAAKIHVIHPNKASHIKAMLAKLIKKTIDKPTPAKSSSKTTKTTKTK